MAAEFRHCGTFWPANAGGEHPNVDTILGLPGSGSLIFVVADSARFWWPAIKARANLAVWRGLPRPDRLPAMLGWDAKKVAAECVNLWDEPKHSGTEWFTPLNELQFRKESGEDWKGYADMAGKLAKLRLALRAEFGKRGQDVRLLFPAWVPGDDLDDASLDEYLDEACLWDGIRLHAYNNADEVRARYWALRRALDTRHWGGFGRQFPILVDETNANHTGADEREMLLANAEICRDDPYCLGFNWFIWETNNAGENDLSVWGNKDRLALFRNPPTVSTAPPADPPIPDPVPPPVPEPIPMPARDPYEFWSATEIAAASGCALADVQTYWPKIHAQLVKCDIADRAVQVAAIGTTAVESSMRPIHEYGTESDWAGYSGGAAYAGRGFIQLTHDYNYRQYGQYLSQLWEQTTAPDMLVNQPDLALDPDVAAAVLALYFVHHTTLQGYSIPAAARAGDWEWVRRLVQGGVVGLPKLIAIAGALGGTTVPDRVTFNRDEPAIAQNDPWSCSTTSLRWALTALGRHPTESWIEDTMKAEGVVTEADGLLDASGKGLADFVTRQYAEFGFYANSEPAVTFDGVALEGDHAYPLLIGGRNWGHWSGVRGYDAGRDLLLLANPAENWKGISQTMNRGQFAALGPFSMVRVLHPDLLEVAPAAPIPEPIPDPVPQPTRAHVLVSEIRERLDELAGLVA